MGRVADLGRFLSNVVGFLQIELFRRGIAFVPQHFVCFVFALFVLLCVVDLSQPSALATNLRVNNSAYPTNTEFNNCFIVYLYLYRT
jgi:hypothetical protein